MAHSKQVGGGGARRLAEDVESVGRGLNCHVTTSVSGGLEEGGGCGAATRVVVSWASS